MAVVLSLLMQVTLVDGGYHITAPWLEAPVWAPTFEEAYWLAIQGHPY